MLPLEIVSYSTIYVQDTFSDQFWFLLSFLEISRTPKWTTMAHARDRQGRTLCNTRQAVVCCATQYLLVGAVRRAILIQYGVSTTRV
jgi:hypothetical protein